MKKLQAKPQTKRQSHKPITDKQYEELTNRFIVRINELAKHETADYPQFNAEFVGAIVANAIHSVDCKGGFCSEEKLFDTVVDLIAKRLSFNISEGIRKKMEADAKAQEPAVAEAETKTDEETPPVVEATSH
jgi:hypothetical protein